MKNSLSALTILAFATLSTAAGAASFSGATGGVFSPPVLIDDKPEPIAVKIRYDAKHDHYCVTEQVPPGSIWRTPTVCRTAKAWNDSGQLVDHIG